MLKNAEIMERRALRNERRVERYSRLVEELEGRATAMASVIPFGQPILVGHHSERWDRRYRERIHKLLRRASELRKEAGKLPGSVNVISSDASDAVDELQKKIASLTELQEFYKKANKLVRKRDVEGLTELVGAERARELMEPDFCGRLGFPDYVLKNNNAVIRNAKERMEGLKRKRSEESTEEEIGEVRIAKDVEANRVRIYFPGKPAREVIGELKQNGFRWSPTEGCWQRMQNEWAMQVARQIAKKLEGK